MYDVYNFIESANKKHNNKYDYSLVNYINMRTNVDIICHDHGIFNQNPATHLSRSGCSSCAGVKRLTRDEFISKVSRIHNNKYDYSLIDYVNNKKKVKILCEEHGIFEQTPQNHIAGRGCPGCANVKVLNIDDFIYRSNQIHNNKYDYSLVRFKNNDSHVDIVCPKHNLFTQRVSSHLSGCGCKSCAMECKTSNIEKKWLDSIGIEDRYRQYRVGNYIVDGYDPLTNTIYEFNGDFWHGNPKYYKSNDNNIMVKKSYGELYSNTIYKENKLISFGYNVISIWESDYKKLLKVKK